MPTRTVSRAAEMTTMKYTLVALVAAVAALVMVGTAAAQGAGFAAQPADDRPLDGTNNPWTADDWRLDRMQERYNLTDAQVASIQEAVASALADGADRQEIQTVVHDQLESFGIDVGEPLGLGPTDAPRGPTDDRRGYGAGPQSGPMTGHGPLGAQDGSCLQ